MVSDGSPWRPLVHVEDICEAIYRSLVAPQDAVQGKIFNVGQNIENYRVREIAEIVAAEFPGCEVTVGPSSGDNRSYRVNFDRIHRELPGFTCRFTARDGARQLREVFRTHPDVVRDVPVPRLHSAEAAEIPAADAADRRRLLLVLTCGSRGSTCTVRSSCGWIGTTTSGASSPGRSAHANSGARACPPRPCKRASRSIRSGGRCEGCTSNGRRRGKASWCVASGAASMTSCSTFGPGRRPTCDMSRCRLDDDNRDAVFIPHGVAHGFQTLADATEVLYQMTDEYAPGAGGRRAVERSRRSGSSGRIHGAIVISERDAGYPDFDRGSFEAELGRRMAGRA